MAVAHSHRRRVLHVQLPLLPALLQLQEGREGRRRVVGRWQRAVGSAARGRRQGGQRESVRGAGSPPSASLCHSRAVPAAHTTTPTEAQHSTAHRGSARRSAPAAAGASWRQLAAVVNESLRLQRRRRRRLVVALIEIIACKRPQGGEGGSVGCDEQWCNKEGTHLQEGCDVADTSSSTRLLCLCFCDPPPPTIPLPSTRTHPATHLSHHRPTAPPLHL